MVNLHIAEGCDLPIYGAAPSGLEALLVSEPVVCGETDVCFRLDDIVRQFEDLDGEDAWEFRQRTHTEVHRLQWVHNVAFRGHSCNLI